ncbi:hypothetical protein JR316_0004571 [Psilocybe cubensis]|uniref:Uncharacterized protein n=1 Tax=Psilocybe cubensis TaxID=181762 RepID=A0ACB8H4P6_PSICU|nr:hypothetical protein JR316_0004571 [Psilocybe cubensis]KAH9482471.1 hypothetical protein JR316_0004571 [Psilocybe cubensis]
MALCSVWTMTILYKRMYGSGRENSGFTLDLNLPIRVMCFAVYIIVAMSLSLLSVTSPSSPAPDLVIASAATVVILIFGTQKDILGVIVFWRRPAPLENQIRVDLKVEFEREADIPPKVPEKDYPTTHV